MDQLLKILEQEVFVLDHGERPDFDVINGIADYFRFYPAICHSPKEALVLEKLKMRNPRMAASIGAADAEHAQSTGHLERFMELVEIVWLEQDIPSQTLDAAASDFIACERRRIEIEERKFLPAALESLTPQDWSELDAKLTDTEAPLFSQEIEARFKQLSERIVGWEREDEFERACLSQGRC